MIDAREIQDFAGQLSLRPEVIEKDYVLGWLLAGIDHHPELAASWVFKGGTCLKKVYFETYRFSEDLDFTLTAADHLDESFLVASLSAISEWIYDQCGIEIPADQLRFNVYENKRGGLSAEGRVYYRGPSMRRRSLSRVKLDLTVDEIDSTTTRNSLSRASSPARAVSAATTPGLSAFSFSGFDSTSRATRPFPVSSTARSTVPESGPISST